MNNFWNNISRYPRFFISSLIGLILVIVRPFRNLFKIKRFRILSLLILFLFIFLLYIVIKNMIAL